MEEVFECGAEGVEESQCVCRDGGEDGEQLKHLQLHHIPVVLEKKHSCQVSFSCRGQRQSLSQKDLNCTCQCRTDWNIDQTIRLNNMNTVTIIREKSNAAVYI